MTAKFVKCDISRYRITTCSFIKVKGLFHEMTKLDKINHRCIQISRNRRRPGCRLNLLFHNKSAGEVISLVKSIVQCSDELNHKIGLKLSRK